MDKTKKQANDIRIGFRSRVGSVISYCEKLLKENNLRTLNFSAVGGSIGTLVNVVEVLKMTTPGLYQTNRIATISYQSVEEGGNVQNQKLYPKLEVVLTLDKPTTSGEGFQDVLSEEDRKKLLELRDKRREERQKRGGEGERRGRGTRRPPFRGGRGRRPPMRGGRPPMRGGRPPMRGGRPPFRGGRGRPPMRGRGGRQQRGGKY